MSDPMRVVTAGEWAGREQALRRPAGEFPFSAPAASVAGVERRLAQHVKAIEARFRPGATERSVTEAIAGMERAAWRQAGAGFPSHTASLALPTGAGDAARMLATALTRSRERTEALTKQISTLVQALDAQSAESGPGGGGRLEGIDQALRHFQASGLAAREGSIGDGSPGEDGWTRADGAVARGLQITSALAQGAHLIRQDLSQGLSVGSLLNSVEGGAEIGALFGPGGAALGAAAGGALGLLGGLFGGHRHPDRQNRDQNPAFFNTPADMDYAAYRFRATGGAGFSPQPIGLDMPPVLPRTVLTLHLDGIKAFGKEILTGDTTTANASLSSASYDLHRPV